MERNIAQSDTISLYTKYNFSSGGSPNGSYLAAGSYNSAPPGVYLYAFNGTSLSLTQSVYALKNVNSVAWNPQGTYLAVGSNTGSYDLNVYAFNGTSLSLTQSVNIASVNTVAGMQWRLFGSGF